jgi:hypothetical protein
LHLNSHEHLDRFLFPKALSVPLCCRVNVSFSGSWPPHDSCSHSSYYWFYVWVLVLYQITHNC